MRASAYGGNMTKRNAPTTDQVVSAYAESIARLADGIDAERIAVMEVCGTHTVTIYRSGLRSILPEKVRLVSGPGCPVCVSAGGYIDAAVELAGREGLTITTYGDMVRVPGTEGSLEQAKARGADVRVVYSVEDALRIAEDNPHRQVVFLGVGFETTAPATAWAIESLGRSDVENFSVFSSHKLIMPAMSAVCDAGDLAIDGFICPGHVSVIIGSASYDPIARDYGRPCVVAGFTAEQVMRCIHHILEQIAAGEARVDNVYEQCVTPMGNAVAKAALQRVFDVVDMNWRGLGTIPASGLRVSEPFARYDAARRFDIEERDVPEPLGCRCGEVVRGAIDPEDCPLFATTCTPARPVGPCMVSREGSCRTHFKYARMDGPTGECR